MNKLKTCRIMVFEVQKRISIVSKVVWQLTDGSTEKIRMKRKITLLTI